MDYQIRSVNESEVLRYLGYKDFRAGALKRGIVPENTPELELTRAEIRELAEELARIARPKGIWKRIPLIRQQDELCLLDGALTLPGKSISHHLKDSQEVILITGTLGITVDQYLRSLQLTDLKKAVMTDSVASVAIENILDQIQAEIRLTLAEGEYLTDRFAPGYGDLPIGLNGTLAQLLDTKRRIGLTVSASGIMIPRKSIMAIIGVAGSAQPQFTRGCANCSMTEECNFSKVGK